MASTTEGKRPLSPHLTIYRLPLSAKMSIFHRATGCAMAGSTVLVIWWFLAAATGPAHFAFVDGLLTSWIGALAMLGSAFCFFYHLMNGLRHLWWDMGRGFDLAEVDRSGVIALIGACALTLILFIIAI
ncbi:MAG: succinate dehydrogenase, cytochrome b556 subunit [Pikeienuella sp.]